MVRVTEELALSPSTSLSTTLPIPSSATSPSRVQVHVYSPAGFQSYPRITISPNSPFYGVVNHLPREWQGDEIYRGLAFGLFKYFTELPELVKNYLRNQYPTTRARRPGSAPALFGEQHAADLASSMLKSEVTTEVVNQLHDALQTQHISNVDIDFVLPPGSIVPLQPEDYSDAAARAFEAYLSQSQQVLHKRPKAELRMKLGELLDTEERYVMKLNELVRHIADDFRQLAKQQAQGSLSPSEEEVGRLFPTSADRILQMNSAFHIELRRIMEESEEEAVKDIETPTVALAGSKLGGSVRVKDPSGALSVARLCLEWFPKFTDSYQDYIKASQHFPTLLNGFLSKQSSFRQRVNQAGEQAIRSVLIEPVQRLPRYSLLIDQIVSSLPITHPALQPMLKARDIIANICSMDDPLPDKPQTTTRMRNMVESWPLDLEPQGRLILAVDFIEVLPPYQIPKPDDTENAGMFLLFSDCIVILKKKVMGLTGRDLLRELDKPSAAGLMMSMTNAAGGPPPMSLPLLVKARVEGRFSEAERENPCWTLRSVRMPDNNLGLFAAVFQEGIGQLTEGRREPAPIRVVVDREKGTTGAPVGHYGVEIVINVSTNDMQRISMNTVGLNGKLFTDEIALEDFMPTLSRRIVQLLSSQFNILNLRTHSIFGSTRDKDRIPLDDGKPENPLVRLEQTFTGYVAALQTRKGSIIGRTLLNRSGVDELAVNDLYNRLIESPFDIDSATELTADIIFVAFEKFLRIAWSEQMGPIMTIQALDTLQARANKRVPGDFADFVNYLFGDMAPQNRRAFTALIKLLADLLEGCGNDSDRGALTLAFAQLLVPDGTAHNYINLLDMLVDDCDRIFEEIALSNSIQLGGSAYESVNSMTRSMKSHTGSLTSNTSSLRRKFGFDTLLRQNSKDSGHGPASRDRPPVAGAFDEIPRPASSHRLESRLETIGEPEVEATPAPKTPKKKRRSSLSDLRSLMAATSIEDSTTLMPLDLNKQTSEKFNSAPRIPSPSRIPISPSSQGLRASRQKENLGGPWAVWQHPPTSSPTKAGTSQKLRLQSPQKLRERLQTEKQAADEVDASLKSELSKIAEDMARVNGGVGARLSTVDIRKLSASVKALEDRVPSVLKDLADQHQALRGDMETTLKASDAKVKAIDQLYKEAMAENELLYEKFNSELGKIVKALKGKGRDDKEELVTKLKEQSEETARVKKENARLRREMASLRAAMKGTSDN
ncbi:unnamed protein product [Parascedosporium putredinis]|uniref:DH domain-containing protein n=1 Tax=Parascedosporium putredinis TaxID=1442378 RepID=A0A9P1M742_9PEZI|nr:unnamed protein product [Parascedosporium putredinis]CAI7987972.1 unnamed protein product [Parascedosporium putredinis]